MRDTARAYGSLAAFLAIIAMVTIMIVNDTGIEEMRPGKTYIIHALSCLNETADASTMDDPDRRFILRLPKECLPDCYPFVTRIRLSDWSPPMPNDMNTHPCAWEPMP